MANSMVHLSPNHGPRRGTDRPDMVVLHYTAMASAKAALDRLCDPSAEVSAHYLIAEDGRTWSLVAEDRRAWHAGAGAWGGVADVNSHAVGIEIAHPGHHSGWPPYPEAQMAALERLLDGIVGRWAIQPERVIGHACMAPGRKIDPGEKLDWRRLAAQSLAVWLDETALSSEGVDISAMNPAGSAPSDSRFRAAARRFGYPVPQGQGWDGPLLDLWHAYAMRFLPGRADLRQPDPAGLVHLERLADRWPVIDPTGSAPGPAPRSDR